MPHLFFTYRLGISEMELTSQSSIVQCPADAAIDIPFVLADMTFLDKSTPLGHSQTSQIGVITLQADAMSAQAIKDKTQGSFDSLCDVSFSLVIHIDNVPDLILW
jgi:hypothetical protein